MEPNKFYIFAVGISAFVVLLWLAVGNAAPDIQAQLAVVTEESISAGEDLNWVTTNVDGQAAVLAGYVPDHQARERAIEIASSISGITEVDNQLKLVGVTGGCQEELNEMLSLEKIQFQVGSHSVSSHSDFLLKMLAIVARNCATKIQIHGHTDSAGNPQENLRLSIRRADAIRDYLIRSGVESHLLRATGFGDSKPIYDNSTPEGRQRNRRIEFVVSSGSV